MRSPLVKGPPNLREVQKTAVLVYATSTVYRTIWCILAAMKRHVALIQAILEHLEEHGNGEWITAPQVPGYNSKQVHYHIHLCDQAGYLEDTRLVSGAEEEYSRYTIRSLTWQGHEALVALRGC